MFSGSIISGILIETAEEKTTTELSARPFVKRLKWFRLTKLELARGKPTAQRLKVKSLVG